MNKLPIPIQPDDTSKATLDFGREAVREGEAFLKAQKGYDNIQRTIDSIMNEDGQRDDRPTWFSKTKDNRLGMIAEEQAAMCTDIKPFWEFTTPNERYQRQAKNFGGLSVHWWLQRQADQRFMEVIKMALVAGSGWAYQTYDPQTEDIALSAEDPRDVIPIRPASNGATIQEADGVIIRRERTVNYMRALFPEKAALIVPDRDGTAQGSSIQTGYKNMFAWVNSAFYQRLMEGSEPAQKIPKVPTLDVYTMYVRDDRRNETGHDVAIGEFSPDGRPLTNWSYIVHPGDKLYPRKRCIVFTNRVVLRDGPSIYWHGKYPISKLTPVSWPFSGCSWLGKGVLWDLIPLQKTLDRLLRGFDDHFEKVFRPDLIGDANSMSQAEMNKIDTRKAGLHIRHKMLGSKGFSLEYPQPLEQFLFEYVNFIIKEMGEISGTTDMANLMRLNQMPSQGTVEKILDAMTFSVKGRSRVIEAFMREFATILAFNFSQFYTLPMITTILGEQGRTPEDMDFDPGTFIPDYVHETDFDQLGELTYEARLRGPLPRYDRAQEFLKQFEFNVQPSSLLAASEVEQKMLYLQLARGGLIDSQTLLEKLQIPNIAEIQERKMKEQMLGLGMQVSAAGRKSSGQEMPRMVIKES